MPLVVLGLSHHSSPVSVRERFAFAEPRVPAALQSLRDSGVADEAVILSTCNRVEIYAVTQLDLPRASAALRKFLVACHDYRDPLTDKIYAWGEPQSVHHLFKVACGLDSMVLGETEILGQLKKAYDLALQNGHTGGRLNKAFQRAFQGFLPVSPVLTRTPNGDPKYFNKTVYLEYDAVTRGRICGSCRWIQETHAVKTRQRVKK